MSKTEFHRPESRSFSPWPEGYEPRRILIIRLHAVGDVAITLPSSVGMRSAYPDAYIEFLTTDAAAPLVSSLRSFDRVSVIPVQDDACGWFAQAIRFGTAARRQKFDVIFDLQRNWVTRTIRRMALPTSWGEFDRYGPWAAADRVAETIRRTGFSNITPSYAMELHHHLQAQAENLLQKHGYDPRKKLIILNPAGLWETRNWQIDNYVTLARSWSHLEPAQFLLIGTGRIRHKAEYIAQKAGSAIINLVEKTSLDTAFAVVQRASVIVTEDSGLMHMAWCSGIPTIALFGSSRHVWSAPVGLHARSLHSGDLPCGQCMEPTCRFGDVHCLGRYTPDDVLTIASELMHSTERECSIQ